jgi:hypothetical protein
MEEGLIGTMRRPHLLPLVAAGCGLWLAAASAQTAPPPRGAETAPDPVRALLGAWDLELAGAPRSCTVTFGPEAAPHGRQLRFPATCRRALPILDDIRAWSVTPSGRPQLHDAQGKTVIAFEEGEAERGFEGKGPDGKQYLLASRNHPRAARRPPANPAELNATAAQRPTRVDPALAPAADRLPGRYAVMRQQNREACRVVLTAAPNEPAPAAFEGPCRDTGLTIFDPVGWRYAGGRLTLVARKGHGVDLVFENGQWRKDPAVGAPLMMRKLGD